MNHGLAQILRACQSLGLTNRGVVGCTIIIENQWMIRRDIGYTLFKIAYRIAACGHHITQQLVGVGDGFAKSSCTTVKGFLSPWRRFFGLGLHADSSIRESARRERGLCLAGFQKRIWLSEKQILNLRCHRITMV
jgi:hypothetical protein